MSSKEGKIYKEYKRKHHNKKSPSNSNSQNDPIKSENGINLKIVYEKNITENFSQEQNLFGTNSSILPSVENSIKSNSNNKYLYQESANDFNNDCKEKNKIVHYDIHNTSNYTMEYSANNTCKENDVSKASKFSNSEINEKSSPSIDSNNDFEVIEKENFDDKINEFDKIRSSLENDTKRSNFVSDIFKTEKERDSSPYTIIDENDMQTEIKIEKIKNQESPLNVEISDSINKEKSIQFLNNNSSESFSKSREKSEEKSEEEIECKNSQDPKLEELQSNTNIPILTKLINSSDKLFFDLKSNDLDGIQISSKTNDIILEDNNNIINFKNSSSNTNSDILSESNNEEERKSIFERLLNTNLEAKHQFRICIVGDSNVGKTSLLMRYCDDTFKNSMTNTIGVDFRVLMLKYNSENIKVQIWDTAGQERFKSISMNYFKSADVFMFVYDVANRSTFENLKNWIEIVEQNNKHSICNFVVGNKCDLEESREVSIEEGKDFAFNRKFNFMETSAKSNKNVELAFEISTLKLIENCKLEIEKTQIPEKRSPTYPIDDGNKFKIDEMSEENLNSKKARKDGCRC